MKRFFQRLGVTAAYIGAYVFFLHLKIPGDVPFPPLSAHSIFRAPLFSMMGIGVQSYITASIVLQAYAYSLPWLAAKAKEPGRFMEELTVIFGVFLSFLFSLIKTWNYVTGLYHLAVPLFHAIGTSLTIFFGEEIKNHGYGNGIGVLICVGIFGDLLQIPKHLWLAAGAIFGYTVFLGLQQKRIPIFFSKSQTTGILPLKYMATGVMPVIFASLAVGWLLQKYHLPPWAEICGMSAAVYLCSRLYGKLLFQPREIALALQKRGAAIEGVRAGNDTIRFLQTICTRLSRIGGLELVSLLVASYLFAGVQATSLLILASTSMEILRQMATDIRTRPSLYAFPTTTS